MNRKIGMRTLRVADKQFNSAEGAFQNLF